MMLYSRLSGVIGIEENILWKRGLYLEHGKIEKNGIFKMALDVRGYEFANIEAHKFHRTIIPFFLAENNLTLSTLIDDDLVELKKGAQPCGKKCLAVAMIHHDLEKMENLDRTYGTATERYFHDYDEGYAWIRGINAQR